MKAKVAQIVGLSVVLFMLLMPFPLAVRGASQLQTAASAEEPNNTFGSASSIAVGIPVDGLIAPVNDVDWYAFSIDHQGELAISITNVAENLAINVRVWNSDKGTVSGWFSPLAAGGDTQAVVDLALPGRYFLEVADGVGNVESTQLYTLLVQFTPTADGDELNNTFGSATAIALGQPYQANILPAADADWYSFDVEGHGELTVNITNVASDLAVSFRLWNSNRETLSSWVSPLAQGGNTTGVLDLPSKGRYFLEVAANSSERSTQPYTLETSFVAAVDSGEPNNSFGQAAPLSLGESIAANILPQNDVDWYRIEVEHHGELSIAVTAVPETLAIRVRVWNSNRETISDWLSPLATGGETTGIVDLPVAGSYFLEVIEANSARSVEPYTFTASFIAAADPYEDNNYFGAAHSLSLEQALQSNILPRGDSDWHSVELGHHGELTILASDVPSNLDINFRVWNSNKETISGWFAPLARGGNTTGVVDIPVAGTYYIEVADGNGDARSIDSFFLQTLFLPAADQGEPNNVVEAATPVTLDVTIPANMLPANDADWYMLELTDAGDLHVLVTNVAPKLEIAFRLWNDEGQTISNWAYPLAAGGNTQGTIAIAEAGTYYLQVVDNRGGRSIQPYLLRMSMAVIDAADMTFTQTVTNTETLTDTESTVEEGTEVITTTTTTLTTTTTIQASGDISESGIVTETEVITDTSVTTRTVEPEGGETEIIEPEGGETGGRTLPPPTTPSRPAPGGSTPPATPTEPVTGTSEITETPTLTETAPITETEEVTPTSGN